MKEKETKILNLNFKDNYKAREEVAIALLHLGYSVTFHEQEGEYYPYKTECWLVACLGDCDK